MTEYSYPWTAVAGDRTRTADTAADVYGSLVATGVIDGLTSALNGANVDVAAGVAMVEGRYYRNTATVSLTPDASKKSYVVLRMTSASKEVVLAMLAGSAGAYPALTQSAGVYEIAIAAVDTTVAPVTVTDTRADTTLCGLYAKPGHDTGWLVDGIVNYRKVGNTVYAQWYRNTNITAGSAATIGTLPAGYRPTVGQWAVSCSRKLQTGVVNTDGTIVITNSDTANQTHFGSATFVI